MAKPEAFYGDMLSALNPPSNPVPRLYRALAHLWPLLSPPGDYAAEARMIREVLDRMLGGVAGSGRRSIMELGGGGGHTLMHLAEAFDTVAVDVSEPMLSQCRRLNPHVQTHRGDMRQLRLGCMFDAVLAHDAIDYMASMADALAACKTAAAHLNPGGIFLLGPNYTIENFVNYDTAYECNTDGKTEVAYVSHVVREKAGDKYYDLIMTILIRCDDVLRIEQDRHRCGLFSNHDWRTLLASTGFTVQSTQNQPADLTRVLFVAVRN